VTLVLMLIAFGALIAAGIPVLLAATSVAATIGITAPLSHLVHAEPTVSSMIVLIGMAVGVDYSLFYLKREREERAKGASTLDAVEIAAATSGHSIVVSGLAVIASMTGLYVFGGATFNSLATGSILVVAIAVLGSITVLPALLARLGRWVDRPRVPLLWRLNRRIGKGGLSRRLLGPVLRRPVAALVVSGLAVAALSLPAFGMKLQEANLDTLPDAIPEVTTFRAMADAFPSEGTTTTVVVKADAGQRVDVRAALDDLEARATASGEFEATSDAVQVSADGRTSVLRLGLPYDESDPRVEDAVDTLRADLAPPALDELHAEYAVGGDAAEARDFVERLRTWLPIVVAFVLLVTMLMMAIAFRSVPLALVSCVLNLASVGVAFGLLTLVFQHGFAEGLLDFSSPGFVIDWIPLFVLVVLVGLSMDYHVFVLSRVREHVRRGLPTRLAVERGISETAGVVTSAAAVMVSVFAIFATLSMLEMKMMGVGLSAAILIDATLIRLVMLPAALVLLGDRVWWPARISPDRGEFVTEPESVLVTTHR
jgi:RND superfamily putative drug exporter